MALILSSSLNAALTTSALNCSHLAQTSDRGVIDSMSGKHHLHMFRKDFIYSCGFLLCMLPHTLSGQSCISVKQVKNW